MILSNFTFNVEKSLEILFINFLKTEIQPLLNDNSLINSHKLFKLLQTDESTVSLQLFFENDIIQQQFEVEDLFPILKKIDTRFQKDYVFFQSVLKEL